MADGSGASTLHLAALSLVGADPPATTADDLPRELWESILAAIVMDDPRNEVRKLPAVRKEWARWFRDGTLYEAANCRLGWYGDLPSLEAVQANVARRSDFPIWVPPATPKAYFQQACQAMCEAKRVYDVAHPGLDRLAETRYLERPYFAKIAEEILMCVSDFITKVPTNHPAFDQLARFLVEQSGTLNSPLMYIPSDCANYGELAKIAVQNHEDALQNVPEDRADYAEIAKLAVQHEGWALQYVPPNRADYGELAMFAVQNNGYAINDVPTGRDDYGELARHAVQQEGQALQDVPSNRPDYGELAKLAVQQDCQALQYVPTNRADYGAIARIAMEHCNRYSFGQDPHPLQGVPTNLANYGELARLAVQNDGLALQYVPTNRVSYGELALLAVQNDGLALQYVPMSRADYGALALLAVQNDSLALQYVPMSRADYGDFARIAIEQGPGAIEFVPRNHADYAELRALHKARWKRGTGRRGARRGRHFYNA